MTRDGRSIPTIQEVRNTPAQFTAPFAEAISRHVDTRPLNLMMPGHAGTAEGASARLTELFGERAVQLDIPSMLSGIDVGDDSPLAVAQRLAADAWGARRTWFMTNGASQANRAVAYAIRALGKRVLMQRSSHSSFYDGIVLAGLIPGYLHPSVDTEHGIAHGVTADDVEQNLRAAKDRGMPYESVYIVSPSYFGAIADVAAISRVTRRYGAALVVDGAWGAHLGFHEALPESPVRLGADLVVSSTHKLASSLSQAAMLHLGNGMIADHLEEHVERSIHMTASTSPSALLRASLDVARLSLVEAETSIEESIRRAHDIRGLVRNDGRFALIEERFPLFSDIVATDPLRIPIDVSGLRQSGHWVRNALMQHHGIYFEMSTATAIVAMIGAGKTPEIDRIMKALDAVAKRAERENPVTHAFPMLPRIGKQWLKPREAYFLPSEIVTADAAVGRVSADSVAAYPPGIPNVLPGEEITGETVSFLRAVASSPTGAVRGAASPDARQLRVVCE